MEDNMEDKKAESNSKEFKVSMNVIYTFYAVIAIALLVFTKIFINFGVWNATLYGIVAIIIYALPIVGATLSILSSKKPNFEFYANVFTLALALLCL